MKLGFAFALVALGLILPNAYAATSSLEVNGVTHEVTYEATGLTVEGIEADTNTATLSVLVTTTDVEGTLVIELNRSFFDSVTDGLDDEFLVLADVEEALFVDEKTDTTRILTITVPTGTSSVDIISLGTTNFGMGEPEAEAPVEESTETPEIPSEPEELIEEPEVLQCGPGTILQDGQCILEQAEPEPEAPIEEPETIEETPQASQCGPGTVLQGSECVLDQTCGPGTIFQDGQCVLDTTTPAPTVSKSQGTQLAIGIVAAFVVSFIVMIILWAIGKAGRRKD